MHVAELHAAQALSPDKTLRCFISLSPLRRLGTFKGQSLALRMSCNGPFHLYRRTALLSCGIMGSIYIVQCRLLIRRPPKAPILSQIW